MACISPIYTAQWADPQLPVQSINGGANASASRLTGLLSVSTGAIGAASYAAWAHLGQNFVIEPAATRVTLYVTPTIEYWVKAESWFGSYYSSEALAHLILWNDTGAEVIHDVRSLFRALAPFWWYVDSGIVRVPVGMVRTVTRTPSAAPQAWHAAFGLQSFAGGAGFGGAHANASCSLTRICVDQFDASGRQLA
ncbi:MAG TPA: hypothetical protein VF432_06825 [Thermoanaerobaculia bacterium]